MAILKIVALDHKNLDPRNPLLIRNELQYILRAKGDNQITVKYYGGRNFLFGAPSDIITQFYAVRNVFHKSPNIQARPFVLSFGEEEHVYPFQANYIAQNICEEFVDYQILYAVHEDSSHLHIHFLINSVNIYDGKMLNFGKQTITRIEYFFRQILQMPTIWCGERPLNLTLIYE